MTSFAYHDSPWPIRQDLTEAYGEFWHRLARPGNWWTGAERIAIAAEVRAAADCAFCLERKAARTPNSVHGTHSRAGELLPNAAVDAVHRIASDPARLSKTWFEQTRDAGVSDGHYVELLGIVVALVSIDSFCRGIGVALHPLPEPAPGEPSQYRPQNLSSDTGWVPMIPNGGATSGNEAGLFGGRRTGNVIRAMSLVPDAVRTLLDLSAAHYMKPQDMGDFSRGTAALDRAQVELIAGRVSALRECFY